MNNKELKDFLVTVDGEGIVFTTTLDVNSDLECGLDEAYEIVDKYLKAEGYENVTFDLIDITDLDRRDITP